MDDEMAGRAGSGDSREPRKRNICGSGLRISDVIGFFSVLIALLGLVVTLWIRHGERQQDQFKNANQAFALNTIESDFMVNEDGVGKQVMSTFKNSSPNPVFYVTLVAPVPLGGISVDAESYHEFEIGKDESLRMAFPTLPPGEKIEYLDVYDQDLFVSSPVRDILDEKFYFCFTDVEQQRWVADYRGARKVDVKGGSDVARFHCPTNG